MDFDIVVKINEELKIYIARAKSFNFEEYIEKEL
jgi:hypothetical protein